jgi:sortase (surface protein transpeptidase)
MVSIDEEQLKKLERLAKKAQEQKNVEAAAKKEYDETSAKIKEIMGELEIAVTKSYKISNSIVIGADTVDKHLLLQEYPDVFKAVVTPGKETRRFAIKPR